MSSSPLLLEGEIPVTFTTTTVDLHPSVGVQLSGGRAIAISDRLNRTISIMVKERGYRQRHLMEELERLVADSPDWRTSLGLPPNVDLLRFGRFRDETTPLRAARFFFHSGHEGLEMLAAYSQFLRSVPSFKGKSPDLQFMCDAFALVSFHPLPIRPGEEIPDVPLPATSRDRIKMATSPGDARTLGLRLGSDGETTVIPVGSTLGRHSPGYDLLLDAIRREASPPKDYPWAHRPSVSEELVATAIRTQHLEDIFIPQATVEETSPAARSELMRHLAAHIAMALAGLPPSDGVVEEGLLAPTALRRLSDDEVHDAYLVAVKVVVFPPVGTQ